MKKTSNKTKDELAAPDFSSNSYRFGEIIGTIQTDLSNVKSDLGNVKSELSNVKAELGNRMDSLENRMRWQFGIMLSVMGIGFTVLAYLSYFADK